MLALLPALFFAVFVLFLVLSPGFYVLAATLFSEIVLAMTVFNANVPEWLIIVALVVNVLATAFHFLIALWKVLKESKLVFAIHFSFLILETIAIGFALICFLLGELILVAQGIIVFAFFAQLCSNLCTTKMLDWWCEDMLCNLDF